MPLLAADAQLAEEDRCGGRPGLQVLNGMGSVPYDGLGLNLKDR